MTLAPCLCGHAMHLARKCSCGCTTTCPDYEALAGLLGREPTKIDIKETESMRLQTGWMKPGRVIHDIECIYCEGTYRSQRKHSKTCSKACKNALHKALTYECDSEVILAGRRDCTSKQRLHATGCGTMTASESYRADKRVRANRGKNDQ